MSVHAPTMPSEPPWLSRALARYTGAALLLSAAVALAGPFTLAAPLQVVLLAAMVGALGLPHGAFDMRIGEAWLNRRFGARWPAPFIAGYLAVAAVVIPLWRYAPDAALACLLLTGVLHFGWEDTHGPHPGLGRRLWRAASWGAVPVGVVCLASPVEVAELFRILGASAAARPDAVAWTAAAALGLAIPGLADQCLADLRDRTLLGRLRILELPVLTAVLLALPPLLGFIAYFCFFHAVRHSLHSAAALGAPTFGRAVRGFVRWTAPPTLATVVLGVAAWIMIGGSGDADAATIRVVFIGLHALTVPHVLLALLAPGAAGAGEGRDSEAVRP